MTLVAVSKTVPAERVATAVRAGFTVLGENRVQEGAGKVAAVAALLGADATSPGPRASLGTAAGDSPSAVPRASLGTAAAASPSAVPRAPRWHLIGPLQANKARRAVEAFDAIETIGSIALARRVDRLAGEAGREAVEILLEVNVDRDPAKSGYDPDAVGDELGELLELPRLRLRGLMSVGRLVSTAEEARPTFRRLRELSERLRIREPQLGPELSMGMSDDFEVAVEEGATIVRIGRAIFGERPHA